MDHLLIFAPEYAFVINQCYDISFGKFFFGFILVKVGLATDSPQIAYIANLNYHYTCIHLCC